VEAFLPYELEDMINEPIFTDTAIIPRILHSEHLHTFAAQEIDMLEDDIPTREMTVDETRALRERMPRPRRNPDRVEVRVGGRIGELLRVAGKSIVVMWFDTTHRRI